MRLSSLLGVTPEAAERSISRLMSEANIDFVAIDQEISRLAVGAFARYGKGRGHKAQLNLADCLSYACAQNLGVPLLFKGNDFSETDIAIA